ncbi:MAG TPA: O-antigen ligase family protein [Flavisolibacter sp.]|jgi:O-antigen ligase|nr:O-antigen ligase family protein [Flavisolibacter sp.]
MTTSRSKPFLLAGSFLLLAVVFVAAYSSQMLLLFAPALLLATVLLVLHPQTLFLVLLFSIPWSVEKTFGNGFGTDLPDEPLMLLLAFCVVMLWMTQHRKKENAFHHTYLLLILVAGFAWMVITVAVSTYIAFSIKYLLAKSWYLLAFVGAPLVLKGDEKLVKQSAVTLLSSMLLATGLALVKHASLGFTFATVNEVLAPFFRNHVNYSALLVFMVPLQVAFFQLTKSKSLKVLLFISIIIVLAALYFSYARGAWLALAAGVAAYWLIRKDWLFRSFLVFVFVVIGAAAVLQHNDRYLKFAPHFESTVFHENFSDHLAATYRGKDVSTAERFYRWVAGVNMSSDRWLTGFGPTTFYHQYKEYTIPAFRTWVSDNPEKSTVHNYFLLLLTEQGIIGLLLFLLLIGSMFWYAQKIYRQTSSHFWKITVAAIGAILWMQCTVNFLSDLIETDKVGSVFYLCLSFLIIADRETISNRQQVIGKR